MFSAGIVPRLGQGFPWAYGPGRRLPVAIAHGYQPEPSLPAAPVFGLALTGNPLNDPRPRGPWVTGPRAGFPRPAGTGRRIGGGQGTDLFDKSTWQRPYRFTP